MNFFNIGPGELLFILIIALIIFGPGKLPEVARGLGKAVGDFRRASQGLTDSLTQELNTSPTRTEERPEPPPVQTASGGQTPGAVSAPATTEPASNALAVVAPQTEPNDTNMPLETPPTDGAQDTLASEAESKEVGAPAETQSGSHRVGPST
jgi:TatA/E family protein of Tat protein translocase